ncbi:MAG TPA: DnaA/Hda family protein [Gemmatimonadales bacterium]|nr:DnaA/Hda family protein [Gemmatimonadales bacterium]
MLNPHARFASFVVGSSNRLAATAAKTVAETPGAAYNPLFLYAEPGLGKTHLLSAIGHEAQAIDPSRTVEYATVDEFVEAYHAALAAGQAEAYRRRFTDADLVLLDDAQLLAGQRELQSELLRLIDVLMAADRQIVLAGDRPPEEIQSLDERLIRRFAGGLVIDIGTPDYETRLAILSRRAADRSATFGPDVLATVAEFPIATVRELLGALNRLTAQQAVLSRPLQVGDARALLGELGHRSALREPPTAAAAPVPVPAPAADEFSDFLSDISASVAQQVDHWRQRLTETVLRFGGEGYRTAALEALLQQEITVDPDSAIAEYERGVVRLRELQAELAGIAPTLGDSAVLRDPARVAEAEAFVADAREAGPPLPGPLPQYTLNDVGDSQTMRAVLEAIRAAADAPGRHYNPLVIVGHSGRGKTHLLHAFGHALRATGLLRVAVLDARQFVDDLVAALSDGTIAEWRKRLRRVDALLVDDVDLLAGKGRSQEELYLLHDALLESGKQMAFTAQGPLAQLSGFEPRLATRLAGGVVIELGAPDRDARRHQVARLLGSAGDTDVIDYLASRPADSLRDVQQLVSRMLGAAAEREVSLTLAVARDMLEGSMAETPRPARRGSGILAPGGGAVRSREKMIETWPDMAERLIEERG